MTPPRCRQVRLPLPRQTCTEKGGFESSHSDENRGVLEYERRTSCWPTPQARTILTMLASIIRFILFTKNRKNERINTTTMVKVVASLPILTKEGSWYRYNNPIDKI